MRTSQGGRAWALALALFLFSPLAACSPVAAAWPITTLTGVGTLPDQTITASWQICTYAETTTTTAETITLTKNGDPLYYTDGCFTTRFPSHGIYTVESPQQIDYSCPYSLLEQFDAKSGKVVTKRACQFGYCDKFHESLEYINPTSTRTYTISSSYGCECTHSVAGGQPPSLPTSVPPLTTVTPISTTYLTRGSVGFTTTIRGTVVVGLPYMTLFSSIPTRSHGYTSTETGGIVVIGTDNPPETPTTITVAVPSIATAFTTSVSGTVIVGSPSAAGGLPSASPSSVSTSSTSTSSRSSPSTTITVPVPSKATAFTTTVSGTVIVGSPSGSGWLPSASPSTTITVAVPSIATAFTTTVSGTVIVGSPSASGWLPSTSPSSVSTSSTSTSSSSTPPSVPLTTLTSYLTDWTGGFTTTIGATVIIETPYVIKTVTLPASATGYTSYTSGTEIIGSPLPSPPSISVIITVTSYFGGGGNAFTTTIGSSVIVGLPYSSVTTYNTGRDGYTSTFSGGSVVVATPYVTSTLYLSNATAGFTQTLGGTIVDNIPFVTTSICSGVTAPYLSTSGGTVYVGSVLSTITTTATISAGSPGYTSIRHANSCSATGTVVIFTPAPYVSTTSYLDHGEPPFTTTQGGSVIVGLPVPTITTTLSIPAGQSAFTSSIAASGSILGTVIVGNPGQYITTTSYLDHGVPPFTTTKGNTVIAGVPVPTITKTSTLAAGVPAYTSIIIASGSVNGTVVIGLTAPYITSTSYLNNGSLGYTTTIGGSVIVGFPVPTVTVRTTVSAGAPAVTETIAACGSIPGTVIIATPASFVTTTVSFTPGAGAGGVSSFTTTVGGTVVIGNPYALSTSYFASAGAPYITTVSGTIIYVTAYITSTSYVHSGWSGFTSTHGGSLIIGLPVPTVTLTSFFSAIGSLSGYLGAVGTQTIAASGSVAGTVIVEFGQGIVTLLSTEGSLLTTQTISASGTAAETVVITRPTECANAGMQMAVYNMPVDLTDDDPTFSHFDPTIYKTAVPLYTDTSTSPYINCADSSISPTCTINIATKPLTIKPTFITIDYHGYFVAPSSGTYNFATRSVDDIFLVWGGPIAYSGWTKENAILTSTYGSYPGTNEVHYFAVILVQGEHYPLRFIYANGDGPGNFDFDVHVGGTPVNFTASNLVGFSCDGILAPPFPAYGFET